MQNVCSGASVRRAAAGCLTSAQTHTCISSLYPEPGSDSRISAKAVRPPSVWSNIAALLFTCVEGGAPHVPRKSSGQPGVPCLPQAEHSRQQTNAKQPEQRWSRLAEETTAPPSNSQEAFKENREGLLLLENQVCLLLSGRMFSPPLQNTVCVFTACSVTGSVPPVGRCPTSP